MGKREEAFVRALRDGLPLKDAAAASGLAEEEACRFLESVARFAGTVPSGMRFGMEDENGPGPVPRPAGEGRGAHDDLIIFTDGASIGNPGPAGAGGVLTTSDGRRIDEFSVGLGEATNNIAEYEAVRIGLERAAALGARRVVLKLDSELVANQLTGRYRVKNPGLIDAYLRVSGLLARFDSVDVRSIPREENTEADRRAQMAARAGGCPPDGPASAGGLEA